MEFSGSPKQVLQELVEEYENVIGRAMIIVAKDIARPYMEKYPDIDLPAKMKY